MNARIEQLRKFLCEQVINGVLITKPENIRYFSGFTGEGYLFVSDDDTKLITDFRYVEQAQKEAPGFETVRQDRSVFSTIAAVISGIHSLGLESDHITWQFYEALKERVPNLDFISLTLDHLRMVKDKEELSLLHKAVEISDKAFTHILPFMKPGVSEADIGLELEFYMRRLGAEKEAFQTIVASGVRSSLPHGAASSKRIAAGDFVTMDFGAVYQGYHSDITRTVVVGKATAKQREIYDTVLKAQLAGVQAVAAGKKGAAVDAVARQIITEAGYGENFGHGLGHGVGLVIHEGPSLSPLSDVVLKENMVVTVEPGIYVPQWGGVRIEDTVMVLAAGAEILTASSKHLIELDW